MKLVEKIRELNAQWSMVRVRSYSVVRYVENVVDDTNNRVSRWADEELRTTADSKTLEQLDDAMIRFEYIANNLIERFNGYLIETENRPAALLTGFQPTKDYSNRLMPRRQLVDPLPHASTTSEQAAAVVAGAQEKLQLPADIADLELNSLDELLPAIASFEKSARRGISAIAEWDDELQAQFNQKRDIIFDIVDQLPADDEDVDEIV